MSLTVNEYTVTVSYSDYITQQMYHTMNVLYNECMIQ